MLASQIPLKQADTKYGLPAPEGQRQWPKRKRSLPQKHADMLPWNMTPHVVDVDESWGPKWAQNFPEVGHLLQTGIEHWEYLDPRNDIAAFSTFALHVKLTQTLVKDVALAEYKLLTFNRRLLYPVVTVPAGNQCLWFNTSNGNLRCGYLSTGGNIWRMCFSDIFTPWEMKGAFCMTHIHVFHLWYF